MSRSDGFPLHFEREPLHVVKRPVTLEEKVYIAALKRSGAVDQATRLLSLQIFSHLHVLLCGKSLYTLDDAEFLQQNEVKQPHLTAPALPLVIALLAHEVV